MQRIDKELITYFLLAFLISWGGILLYLSLLGFDLKSLTLSQGLFMFALMLLGPSIAGLFSALRFDGVVGARRIVRELGRWKASPALWSAVLLANVVVLLGVLLSAEVVIGPEYAPGLAFIGLPVGLLGGALEELGWTGFATPRLLARTSPLKAGVLLGGIWACWHGLADYAGNASDMSAGDWVLRFAFYWVVPLIAYRVLMTWVYAQTRSLLLAIIAHASYTGWQMALAPSVSAPFAGAGSALLWYVPFAFVLSGTVLIIIYFSRFRSGAPQALN